MTNSNYKTNMPNNDGETALMWIARNGHLDTVFALAKGLNAKVNAKNEGTPLLDYLDDETKKQVLELRKKAAAQNEENDPLNEAEMLGWNVVMSLAVKGKTDTERLRRLIDGFNVDIDARDKYGRTACMLAAIYGNTETMFDLVRLGADISLRSNNACSVFDYISVRDFYINRPDGEDIETKKKIIELRKEYEKNHKNAPKMADDLAKKYLPNVVLEPVSRGLHTAQTDAAKKAAAQDRVPQNN